MLIDLPLDKDDLIFDLDAVEEAGGLAIAVNAARLAGDHYEGEILLVRRGEVERIAVWTDLTAQQPRVRLARDGSPELFWLECRSGGPRGAESGVEPWGCRIRHAARKKAGWDVETVPAPPLTGGLDVRATPQAFEIALVANDRFPDGRHTWTWAISGRWDRWDEPVRLPGESREVRFHEAGLATVDPTGGVWASEGIPLGRTNGGLSAGPRALAWQAGLGLVWARPDGEGGWRIREILADSLYTHALTDRAVVWLGPEGVSRADDDGVADLDWGGRFSGLAAAGRGCAWGVDRGRGYDLVVSPGCGPVRER